MSKNKKALTPEEKFEVVRQMLESCHLMTGNNNSVIITLPIDGGFRRVSIESKDFNTYVSHKFRKTTGKILPDKIVEEVKKDLYYKQFQKDTSETNFRIKRIGDTVYYDLNDKLLQYVKIDENGWEILEGNTDYFSYNPIETEQVVPKHGGDIDLLRKYVNFSDEGWILFKAYLVSCFYEGIQHPLMNVNGVWGSGKSTVAKLVKSLVDPAKHLLTDMPTAKKDFVVTLISSYYMAFDNLSKLTPKQSDMICKCITGGSASFRELYTDMGLVNVSYDALVSMNGISDVITRGDLADRTLYFESLIIDEDKRIPDSEFWKEFEKDKPYILGGIFDILSKAISLYPTIQLKKIHRLGDFHKLGCAIAKAMSPELESVFCKLLNDNKRKQLENTFDNTTMLRATFDYLDIHEDNRYEGTVSQLYASVKAFIKNDCEDKYNLRLFPVADNAYGRKLKEYAQLCRELGWDIYLHKSGNSYVEIKRAKDKSENTPTNEIVRKPIYFIRTPIITRKPILTNKSAKVIYAAKEYKTNLA
ncbi:MAG: hypothetical protein IJG16_06150 [Clostridia bacterium]|nr:hypothetical protein [Clostridia bacterium]